MADWRHMKEKSKASFIHFPNGSFCDLQDAFQVTMKGLLLKALL
jgi:hypothetical protein